MEGIEHLDFEPWQLAYSELDAQGGIHERYTADGNIEKRVFASTTGEVMTTFAENGQNTECVVAFPNGAIVTLYTNGGMRAVTPMWRIIDLPTLEAVKEHFGDRDMYEVLDKKYGIDLLGLYEKTRAWRTDMGMDT